MNRQRMRAFVIRTEDLHLEPTPFASGGQAEIYLGTYHSARVAAKVHGQLSANNRYDERVGGVLFLVMACSS